MKSQARRKLPIGIQTFRDTRDACLFEFKVVEGG